MKQQSISKNMIFQFLYQALILIIPLILAPYLTRTLQETALGVYSYTNSIAYYFVMLSMLGISRHGQRVIAQNLSNEIALRKTFWSLFFVHILVSVFFTCTYLIYIGVCVNANKVISLIQTFYVLSALFDITWLFYGLENFKSVVIKNAFVKIVECGLIFLFVKNPEDLWKYTLICTGGICLGQLVMIPQAIKLVKPIKFSRKDMLCHVKPLLVLSISVIAVSLYTVFDKTLLGIMTPKENVAFYDYSNKIINIPKTIISVIGTVMFPRACKLAQIGDNAGQKKYIEYSLLLTVIIGIGSIFGLLAIATPFSIFYYGESFSICGNIIKALSPLILIIGVGDVIRTQYMLPNHMDRHFNICIFLNALVNIIISILLIPSLGIYGAVIGTICAELFGLIYQIVLCRKFIYISDILRILIPFVFIGVVMFFVIRCCQIYINESMRGLMISILIGGCTYIFFTLLYFVFFKKEIVHSVVKTVSRKIHK